ncbi:MAG: 2-oxoglutarate and iron-dependent oxygenase domain-containing protein, partial [Zavarzinia sp.]|nr:2-oxoglutarate and iron-dependent oxygenase domain-containing protein [Zavarzinia sp.]
MSVNIPLIDISAYPAGGEAAIAALARTVDRACTDIGFLLVSGHGVPDSLIDDMRRVSRRFFARTEAEKLAHRMPPDRYRGYVAMESEALANSLDEPTPPDIKESFNIGPLEGPSDAYRQAATPANFFAENQWPEDEEFQAVWSRYYRSMEDLSFRLMRIFALALGMPERFFDDKIDRHITNFTVLHYPAQERPPQPGQLRAGAHTDYGSLTIVKPDAAPGGLQVRDKAGQWVDVPYVPDAFVVNLGDLMADWTND